MIPGYNSLLGKIIRLPLRAIPRDYVVRAPFGPLRGLRWVTSSSIHGCWLGTYESDKVRSLLSLGLKGKKFFDIGANVGFYALLAASHGADVVAFEPLPANVDLIRRHLALNELQARVMQVAVAENDGTATFAVGANNSVGQLSATGFTVETIRLDSLQDSPDIIKIDVEGAEYQVLQGAVETLRRRPAIYLATHSELLKTQCHGFLKDLGYSLEELDAEEVLAY